MKLKMFICLLAVALFVNSPIMASVLSFDSTERETLENKSKQQASNHLKLKMSRSIVDDTIVFILDMLSIKQNTKMLTDIKNIVTGLAKIKSSEREVFAEDDYGLIEVRVEMEIDVDNVGFYIDKIKKDKNSKYKKEFETIRKEKLDLENKLAAWSKFEYEKNFTAYTKEQFAKFEQKEKEYNSLASKELVKNKNVAKEQKPEEVVTEVVEETVVVKKEEPVDEISPADDSIKKARLENKNRIKEIEKEAKAKMASWSAVNDKNKDIKDITIENANKTRKDYDELFNKLSQMLVINKENLVKTYDDRINLLNSVKFSQDKPVKDQWETTEEFNKRVKEYEEKQNDFVGTSQREIEGLQKERENVVFVDDVENLQALVSILNPFVERLKDFQVAKKYESNIKPKKVEPKSKSKTTSKTKTKVEPKTEQTSEPKAKLVSLGDVNADEHYFVMCVEYLASVYYINFDFGDIGIEKAKAIYASEEKLEIEPLFSLIDVSGELKLCLTAFEVRHKDLYVTKHIDLKDSFIPFKEIVEFKVYEDKLNNINDRKKKLVEFDNELDKTIKEFETTEQLKKFTAILSELKRVRNSTNLKKVEKIDEYESFINSIKNLDNIIVSVSASGYHTAGLKKNGKVVAVGNNTFGQCNVQKWDNILAIAAGENHTLGLNKEGSVISVGDDSNGKRNVEIMDKIVSISAGENASACVRKDGTAALVGGGETVQQTFITNSRNVENIVFGRNYIIVLKKNGTVESTGDNSFGQCSVSEWKNIKKVSAGENHTVGLKKDGTVVATGKNNDGQCNVSRWKDIVDIVAGYGFTVGLKKDGTVVCTEQFGKFDFSSWDNIVAIFAGCDYVIGIKNDGSLVSEGSNQYGQRNVLEWSVYLSSME